MVEEKTPPTENDINAHARVRKGATELGLEEYESQFESAGVTCVKQLTSLKSRKQMRQSLGKVGVTSSAHQRVVMSALKRRMVCISRAHDDGINRDGGRSDESADLSSDDDNSSCVTDGSLSD